MNDLERALRLLVRDLEAQGAPYALVGGLAVSARAEPRLTRDADVVISTSDDHETQAVIRDLAARGYDVGAILEHEPSGRIASVRMSHPEREEVVLDLLFASSGIESEIARQAETLEVLPGMRIPVARTGHLVAMKLLASDERRRPADADDIRALLAVASPSDIEDARAAVEKITDRGFNRGRDLARALDEAVG